MSRFASLSIRYLPAIACAVAVSGDLSSSRAAPAQITGEQVYGKYCATCHDMPDGRVPPRDALKKMSPARIMKTMDFGLMMSIAYPMRRDEREAVARFLGQGSEDPPPPASAFCKTGAPIMAETSGANWNGWSPGTNNMRFQSADKAGLKAEQLGSLKLKWAFGF